MNRKRRSQKMENKTASLESCGHIFWIQGRSMYKAPNKNPYRRQYSKNMQFRDVLHLWNALNFEGGGGKGEFNVGFIRQKIYLAGANEKLYRQKKKR